MQTVKAESAGAAGLFVRPEWERSVTGDTPVLDDTTPVRALLGDRADAVAPVFEVRVKRRTWIVEEAGARIELAQDQGEIALAERTSPVCEVELELKSGEPAALFAFCPAHRCGDAGSPRRAEQGRAGLSPDRPRRGSGEGRTRRG